MPQRAPTAVDTHLTSSQLGLPRRASSARSAHLEMWPTSLTAMFMLINYAHITYVYHVWFILPPWSWMKICTWAWQCMKLCRWVASSLFSVLSLVSCSLCLFARCESAERDKQGKGSALKLFQTPFGTDINNFLKYFYNFPWRYMQ